MYKHILVPLDGSARAEHAIPVAARIARASGGTVDLLRVVYPPVDYGVYLTQSETLVDKEIDAAVDAATAYLAGIAGSAALAGISTNIEAITGAVAQTLLSYTESEKIDLIIMCSHGYTGLKRWMLGSVAEKVARHTTAPILLLRENGPALIGVADHQPTRALVALDGSSLAETVLQPTIDLLTALSAPAHGVGVVHLLRVVDVPMLEAKGKSQANIAVNAIEQAKTEAASYLTSVISILHTILGTSKQLEFTSSVTSDSDVVGAIVKEAQHVEHTAVGETNAYAFIAMSTHGRGSMEHWMAGSTTERTLHGTQLPLLIMRPHSTENTVEHAQTHAFHIA